MASWEAYVFIAILIATLALMIKEIAPPDMLMMGALASLVALQIITIEEGVTGFSNTGMLTVGVLFIIAEAIQLTGAIDPVRRLLERFAQRSRSQYSLLAVVLVPISVLSGFLNNTPVVAMSIGVFEQVARRAHISPSKLLMPLSYASILGGTTTLIGTSTNLVAVGLAEARDPDFSMGFFELAQLGLPILFVGLLYIFLFSDLLLPGTKKSVTEALEHPREYITVVTVRSNASNPNTTNPDNSSASNPNDDAPSLPHTIQDTHTPPQTRRDRLGSFLRGSTSAEDVSAANPSSAPASSSSSSSSSIAGKTIQEAGLRNLDGLYLVQIERQNDVITAPAPSTVLLENDRLYFAGVVNSVISLSQIPGLLVSEDDDEDIDLHRLRHDHILVEAVVANHSPLVHRTARETQFRSRYNAAIVAVHRHGTRLNQQIGRITFQAGDTLLLLCSKDFLSLHHDRDEFALVSRVDGYVAVRRNKAWIAILLTLAMIGASLGGISLLLAAMVAAGGMLITRCITPREAREAINLEVLFVIAAAFGISKAAVNSGAADLLASGLLKAAAPTGTTGLYICVYIATVLFSSVLTNNAAVTLIFPVAYEAAADSGLDFRRLLMLLMVAASASFCTPTGYQTNLLVYGPGGYEFRDYLKFGGPLQLVLGVVTVAVVVTIEFWWLWSLAALIANVVVLVVASRRAARDPSSHQLRNSPARQPHQPRPAEPPVRYFFQPDLGLDEIIGDLHPHADETASLTQNPDNGPSLVSDPAATNIERASGSSLGSRSPSRRSSLARGSTRYNEQEV